MFVCVWSAARSYTGFYLHPLAASMRTLGCGETPIHEHLLVYWVGAIGGIVVGVSVQPIVARSLGGGCSDDKTLGYCRTECMPCDCAIPPADRSKQSYIWSQFEDS